MKKIQFKTNAATVSNGKKRIPKNMVTYNIDKIIKLIRCISKFLANTFDLYVANINFLLKLFIIFLFDQIIKLNIC